MCYPLSQRSQPDQASQISLGGASYSNVRSGVNSAGPFATLPQSRDGVQLSGTPASSPVHMAASTQHKVLVTNSFDLFQGRAGNDQH